MVKGFALLTLFLFSSLVHSQATLQRIAFGSCNNQYHHQPLWKDLAQESPDLFIWGGDIIYADTTEPKLIKAAYDKQNENPDYKFFKSKTPIIGTWDDHDFGFNNATGIFSKKMQSQIHFLDFIGEPLKSPRRAQEGIYTSYEYGSGEKKIKIILLDNRYFKGLNPEAPMLGKDQWTWLEAQLKNSTASIHFIVGGLSILSPKLMISEEWADHPVELNRFLRLMDLHKPKGLVVLSGDKHFASIFKRWGHLEFMSSGMTHTLRKGVRAIVGSKYPNAFFGLNYGLIDIAWEGTKPLLTMAIRDRNGRNIHQKKFHWEKETWLEQ